MWVQFLTKPAVTYTVDTPPHAMPNFTVLQENFTVLQEKLVCNYDTIDVGSQANKDEIK